MAATKDDLSTSETIRQPGPLGSADTVAVTTPGHGAASVPTAVDPTHASLAPPGDAARYEARSVLGRGGMGEVTLCRDRNVGREIALKRLLPELAGGDSTERFLREARVQGQLEHPAVVPVYDIGTARDGGVYFTMKRVHGRTLSEVLDALAAGDADAAQKYGRRRLLSAFSSLCLAIDFAHARGVLHRDLKPGNVMLGDFGEVHVLDWGVAKLVGAPADARYDETAERVAVEASSVGETVHGALMGTPGYMPPEQALGQIDKLDRRSDVYALGAILFGILYGRPLHPQPTPFAKLTATMYPPEFPEGRADVAPELEAICRRAVALAMEDRFSTARELAETLDRYLDGERDEERRRELAEQHVADARRLLAGDAATADRGDAMRALGRALALDPSHAGALGLLRRLLTELPSEVPEAARPALERTREPRRLEMARTTGVRLVTWILTIPVVVAFGVSSWPLAGALIGSMVVAAGLAFAVRASGKVTDARALVLMAVTGVAIGLMSLVFGPFVLVPSLASTNAMFFAMELDRRHRPLIVATAAAAIVVPWALSVLGVGPTWYTFTAAGELVIRSPMVFFPSWLTQAFLLVVSGALVVTPTLLAGRVRDQLRKAEERVFLQAWNLGRLLPEGAQE